MGFEPTTLRDLVGCLYLDNFFEKFLWIFPYNLYIMQSIPVNDSRDIWPITGK